MNLHVIKSKKFKTTVICLLIRQVLERETATVNAVIPYILARGSAKYPTVSEINSALESMYGSVFDAQVIKKGEEQIIQLYMEFIGGNEKLKCQALEFLKEILLNPLTEGDGFNRDYVESEKKNLRLAIESRINNKGEYTKLRCLEKMCKDERFGIYGDGYAEDIEALTAESIYAQYKKLLQSPIEIVVLGNEDKNTFEEQLAHIFRNQNTAESELPVPGTEYERQELKRIEERCNITQGKICMGFRTGVPNMGADFYKLLVMNEIFGGSAGSKLFVNIREKENLCYYINSFVYRFKGIIFVQSGVDEKNFDRVIELVSEQIEAMKQDKISDDEISCAKKSLIKRLQSVRDYQAGYLDFFVSQLMARDSEDIDDVIRHIERVDRQDLPPMAESLWLDTVFTLKKGGENNG